MKNLSDSLKIYPLILALAVINISCASSPEYGASNAYVADPPPVGAVHVIQKGENLYRLSKRYGVGVEELKRYNNIWDVHDIKIGTRIYIPQFGDIKSGQSYGKRWYKATQQASTRGPARTSVRFIWPVKNVDVSSPFGIRADSKHDGIDLRNPRGTPIMAAAAGKVIFSGDGPSGYGNTIMIKHDNNTITVYAHNDRNIVDEGQTVSQGQQVATVGRSGRASGYHVHFEMRINRKPMDPEKYLPRRR